MAVVLVVDDDPALRTLAAAVLREREGHEVLEAPDGEAALEVLSATPVHLVLTDLRMPRLGGLDLIHALRARWPTLPALVMSASGQDDEVVQSLQAGALDFIRKPFRLEHLLYAVRSALAVHPATAMDLRYEKAGWLELTADSAFETVARFRTCVERLTETRVAPEVAEELRFAVDELGRNAVEWGNRGVPGRHVHMSYCLFSDKILFKIEDEGEGFRPEAVPDPSSDPAGALRRRQEAGKRVGGFGIHLVRKLMDEVIYNEKGNVVILAKYLGGKPA